MRPVLQSNLQKYQSRNPIQQFLIKKFLNKIRKVLKGQMHGFNCDIGCGEGFVLKEHKNIIGIDNNIEALEFAATHIGQTPLICASVYQLPFHNKAFNCGLLLEVLEHLESPQKALLEASRVSRMLLISVPHEPFFQIANLARGKNLRRLGNDVGHIQHWNKKSFGELLKPYGTIIRFEQSFPWLIALIKTD